MFKLVRGAINKEVEYILLKVSAQHCLLEITKTHLRFLLGELTVNQDKKVLQIGNYITTGNWKNPQRGRVYSTKGIAPTNNTGSGGGHICQILVKKD
ncbi:hypothetical protein [Bacteroides coprosuis]|uniref:hypothetical protein n=1 Tax=Bacteroides coprosuis TaxID=151276 RepID=UPI001D9E6F2B|nr:hypothetical protein [Bacteroides coprosuis]HJD91298.1 hypothetical protein [Bacteroides coprosuis]